MDKSCISAFSDTIDADDHKHWMLQLFYYFRNDLLITLAGNEIRCKCVLVNTDVIHKFTTQNELCFTMLIDAASSLALELRKKYLIDKEYHIFDKELFVDTKLVYLPYQPIHIQQYEYFASTLFYILDITIYPLSIYDDRILKVIKQLETCDFTEYSIKEIAKSIAISPSRLSHLFKEQSGIPLKSFILLHMVQRAYIKLLQTGDISNAALETGFDSPSHFAATSKRLMGMSATAISKDSVYLKAFYI